MNPYQRELTQTEMYRMEREEKRAARRLKEEARKKKAVQNIISKVQIGAAFLFVLYILAVPVHNPFKYEWVKVTVQAGDTAYELQKKYAPGSNTRLLLLEATLKNTKSIESLHIGDEIYLVTLK